VFAALGVVAAAAALLFSPRNARMAAAQDWSPFVLVAGLLLIGLVADEDGLFAAAGHRLARSARNGSVLFIGAAVVIAAVTAVLNLDTSVAFLTPVLVYAAWSRGEPAAPLLYASLLLSNAASLLLPGSNLTNLIVLGHLDLSGGEFIGHMWLAWVAAVVVTAGVIAFVERRSLRTRVHALVRPEPAVMGVGLAAVALATVLVAVLPSPAIPVAVVGGLAVGARMARDRHGARRAVDVLAVPILVGLFGVAVALGTLGRAWSGPAELLAHLDAWGTSVVAGMASVLLNNLPAASLLAARAPQHPFALLVGLNLGPNLFVTGSLAWLLWLRGARSAGVRPSVARAARLGAIAVPLSIVAAVGALALTGST
jgi:arsenical pump membrane protein